ncbi:store-operated calcium entry-associated regulatory factor-like protein [Dinothrombium tinctorium]|uniref:Store-operated calcium entry-associated regulatory factor n=1 Tax=Dinothrombium tinctorium TaxID=1965070 RepID=A0A443QJZ2_9ACAR|nr:store-operated calcium entry-associated regulatory factor-like protein [Dinothrombium tinctorium]
MSSNRAILLLFTAALALIAVDAKKDRVKLKEVETLTFRQNAMTRSRRSHSIPQLNCIGGTAANQYTPKTVQCYNRGFDGNDVQWECKAELKNKYVFGNVFVNCEGYDYPEDPFILADSCGLEYELDFADDRYERKRSPYDDDRKYIPKKSDSGTGLTFILVALFGMAAIYFICLPNSRSARSSSPPPPPPPGFRTDFPNDGYDGCENTRQSSNFGGNLWSGVIGAGLGYMLGRNSQRSTYTPTYTSSEERNRSFDDDNSESFRSASAFASTRRR